MTAAGFLLTLVFLALVQYEKFTGYLPDWAKAVGGLALIAGLCLLLAGVIVFLWKAAP